MSQSTPSWLQEYQQPFIKQYNVQCHSNHIHPNNMPAAGLVLVRLNESSRLEILLFLRSSAVVGHPNTWCFPGGDLNCINEDPLAGALRHARDDYGIISGDVYPLGLRYKRDHGGVKFLAYNYIFAGYNGLTPAPLTQAYVRSQWFSLDALPNNLQPYVQEDLPALQQMLYVDVSPILLKAKDFNTTCYASTESRPGDLPQPRGLSSETRHCWGAKTPTKVDSGVQTDASTINANGKRELSQQTKATNAEEPDSKKAKTPTKETPKSINSNGKTKRLHRQASTPMARELKPSRKAKKK
ncbi:hypothetical protein F4680DRAFT_327593 [Xylaria scruposa]|nr:hypothetical protein F4680DRAFT_327593 [Xylaria scruposa]